MRLLGLIVLAGLLAIDANAAESCKKLVATGSPDYAPYLWRDPQSPRHLIGADADLLKQIGQQLGIRIELLYAGTRAEAEEDVRSGRADLLLASRLSLEQLEQMDYVHPAMQRTLAQVWMRQDRQFPYAGWDDLLGRSGMATTSIALGSEFDSFARESLTLQRAPELAPAFARLVAGEIDYVLAERYPAQALVAQLGISGQVEASGPPVSSVGLYLALSHNSACNDAELRGQLARKMTELVGAGVPETLLQQNLQLWQAQQPPRIRP
ncbi:substrate-binding periplasmic protein [Pseudomonas sp. N040]|uniref:substrate-binding periplasmic protein n=1 Tax=Pseudomonas sp. N040 TaxID=2785325 RepID=UPI0035BE51EE